MRDTQTGAKSPARADGGNDNEPDWEAIARQEVGGRIEELGHNTEERFSRLSEAVQDGSVDEQAVRDFDELLIAKHLEAHQILERIGEEPNTDDVLSIAWEIAAEAAVPQRSDNNNRMQELIVRLQQQLVEERDGGDTDD
ncbi:hypothetical protein SAMN06269185_3341 [Natronoarchaeum philippinense]|uniref:Uncharacterized protein n=1 Tax=Natronoarchaeum philippinense TaxID=558529 RepID=A0A285P9E7_NATPI|nr:hypothetical protein [Natronoarchaeum philippinense]SNZ18352.1 hypothetical protein SAMN06269185_3341 [Natronoarchaeum philippinense]